MATTLGAIALAALLGAGAPVTQAPATACRITDDRLTEISGMVATADGYVVVNDGADDPAARRVFFLDQRCSVRRTVSYPSRPRDTEDLARSADGTLWVGDIGDNGRSRTTIALWRLAPGARSPKLHRLTYPDGPHDAEALLVTRDGTPVVVTKEAGSAGLYQPVGELRAGRTTALRRAGQVNVPITGTSNPFSLPGRLVVTGGANSPDGQRAVLRTYADAFEYDLPDGDLIRGLTEGSPRTIALPDEPQGESITYSPDGTALLTVSETTQLPAVVLRYPLSGRTPPAPRPSSAPPPAPAAAAGPASEESRLSAEALAAGVVLLGAVVALGLFLMRRRRA